MTHTLKNIFSKLNKLPLSEQNAIAYLLSEELSWEKSFLNSQNELLRLSSQAVIEYRNGKTKAVRSK